MFLQAPSLPPERSQPPADTSQPVAATPQFRGGRICCPHQKPLLSSWPIVPCLAFTLARRWIIATTSAGLIKLGWSFAVQKIHQHSQCHEEHYSHKSANRQAASGVNGGRHPELDRMAEQYNGRDCHAKRSPTAPLLPGERSHAPNQTQPPPAKPAMNATRPSAGARFCNTGPRPVNTTPYAIRIPAIFLLIT